MCYENAPYYETRIVLITVKSYSDTACQTLLDVVTIAYDGSGIYVEAAPDGSFSGEYVDSDGQGLSRKYPPSNVYILIN